MYRMSLFVFAAALVLAAFGCNNQSEQGTGPGANRATPGPSPQRGPLAPTTAKPGAPGAPAQPGTAGLAPGGKSLAGKKIAVVPKGMLHDFWKTVEAGARQAAKEEGIKESDLLWKGPSSETALDEQINIIQDFTTQKVDAIVMAACDAKALVPAAKKADAARIPIVTIDSGLDQDIAKCFVATDNPKGASDAAKELARILGDKGTVGLIPFVKGSATSDMREKGFTDELKKHPGIKLDKVLYSSSQVEKGRQVTEDMLTGGKVDGIFACNEPGAVGAATALEQRGMAGKVKLVGFDSSPAEIAALQKGSIQALVVQNPFKMGYDGVKTACKVLRGEKVDKRVDTGVTVVTKENLNKPEIQKLLYPLGKK